MNKFCGLLIGSCSCCVCQQDELVDLQALKLAQRIQLKLALSWLINLEVE